MKYYWLKVPKDFMKRHDITLLRRKHGPKAVNAYLTLLLESVDHEGRLRYSGDIPYTDADLSDLVEVDFEEFGPIYQYLIDKGLMILDEDRTIVMTYAAKHIGSETDAAERQRKRRAKKDTESDNVPDCTNNVKQSNTEIEIEKEIEIETEKEIDIKTPPKKKPAKKKKGKSHKKPRGVPSNPFEKRSFMKKFENVDITTSELKKLIDRFGKPGVLKILEDLNNYKGANGKPYVDDYYAFCNFARRDGLKEVDLEEKKAYEAIMKASDEEMKKELDAKFKDIPKVSNAKILAALPEHLKEKFKNQSGGSQ